MEQKVLIFGDQYINKNSFSYSVSIDKAEIKILVLSKKIFMMVLCHYT